MILDDYVIDVLMRDLVGHDRRPVAFLVYLWLAVAHRQKTSAVQISYQDLAESIGVSKSSVQAAIGWLIRRKLLGCDQAECDGGPAIHGAVSMEGSAQEVAAAEARDTSTRLLWKHTGPCELCGLSRRTLRYKG